MINTCFKLDHLSYSRLHHIFCILLSVPSALTVSIMKSTKSSSVVVQWDEVDDSLPTTYLVTWTSENDRTEESSGLVDFTSYTISGLTLDTVYIITVAAHNDCGTGPEYKTSISLSANTNPNTVIITAITISGTFAITSSSTSTIANIVMYPSSTVHPADTTTPDETSKISGNSIYYTEY